MCGRELNYTRYDMTVDRKTQQQRSTLRGLGRSCLVLLLAAFLSTQTKAQGNLFPPAVDPPCPAPTQYLGGLYVIIGNGTGCPVGQAATVWPGAVFPVGTTGTVNTNSAIGLSDNGGGLLNLTTTSNQSWATPVVGPFSATLELLIDVGAISTNAGYYDADITIAGTATTNNQVTQLQPSVLVARVVIQEYNNLSVSLVDPIPGFLSGPAVTADPLVLYTDTQIVQGVAADGVTQVVAAIQADNAGDQLQVTLFDDQQVQSSNSDEDGAMGILGTTVFGANQVVVNAENTPNGPEAFLIYRAPVDFARLAGSPGAWKTGTCGNQTATDDQLPCRSVSLQVLDLTDGLSTSANITILRPPVVMIHGLWDNWQTWDNFSPLVNGPNVVDSRFSVGRVSYDTLIGPDVIGTDPFYPPALQEQIQANSLGFAYNAPSVLAQINQWMHDFKKGNNPLGISAAAVQADVVAHSMGGDIARTIVLQPSFLSNDTFGQGNIHKLITIDTPHLGSQLAIQTLSPPENEGCMQNLLANNGKFALNLVNFSDGSFWNGAMLDLQGDDTTGQLSGALSLLTQSSPHPLPTSMIAGVYTNFAALNLGTAFAIRNIPILGCPSDPLAQQLTPTGWPQVFHSNPNDAIVTENSQLNGLTPVPGSQFFGYVHSPGTEKLGFAGPSVLDPGPVPTQVIFLLNTPWKNTAYYYMLNP